MKSLPQICLGALLVLAFATACRHGAANTNQSNVSGPAAAVKTTTYHGVGVVETIDAQEPSIEINHEDIKGLMQAMTMEFDVKDKSLLNGIKPGDRIEFTLEDGVGGLKVTEISKR